jgi:hypothetical protein
LHAAMHGAGRLCNLVAEACHFVCLYTIGHCVQTIEDFIAQRSEVMSVFGSIGVMKLWCKRR